MCAFREMNRFFAKDTVGSLHSHKAIPMDIRFMMFVLLSALICACNGSGDNAKAPSASSHAESSPVPQGQSGTAVPAPAVAEALPADGGDVGAAYRELIAALRALDSDRANRLFEHYDEQPVALNK